MQRNLERDSGRPALSVDDQILVNATMSFYRSIEAILSESTGLPFTIETRHSIGGGCISLAERISGNGRAYFIKSNTPSFLDSFETEFESLEALRSDGSVFAPEPIATGCVEDRSYLALEYVSIQNHSRANWARFGQQLASLHRTQQPYYGWHRDNYIGATPQRNPKSDVWLPFFQEHRLRFQVELAESKGFVPKRLSKLYEELPKLFQDYRPMPSLLHGDLWSGNVAFRENGDPLVFDPCCYYGDREADIAFTQFFGGFPSDFYDAYQQEFPLDSGYTRRKDLYNLYHCLNHFNLFGPPYDAQAQAMIDTTIESLRR